MLGIHTVYTPPTRHGFTAIHDQLQFEVFTMILSCLWWRKLHGPIKLYCDRPFFEHLTQLGLTELWDEIDIATLEQGFPEDVNHNVFWAWAKMWINSLQTEPFVSLDIDLFQNRPYDFSSHDFIFSHRELVDDGTDKFIFYPDFQQWPEFKAQLAGQTISNWAANVAILAVNNIPVYQDFYHIACQFVANNNYQPTGNIHPSAPMTFVEQRLLASVIESTGSSAKAMIDMDFQSGSGWLTDLTALQNPGITHLWGLKDLCRRPDQALEKLKLSQNIENHFAVTFPIEYAKYSTRIKELCVQ